MLRPRPVCYFSAEFGLHESLPIYSGGLGVLAGDHLKSASDLGIPLVGVGLLYAQGYFRQTLDSSGWQQELYLNVDLELLPIESVSGADGKPLLVAVATATGVLHARVWKVEVGRITLYLLDSNVPENSESDRSLTARLYGGDARVRIRQELLLGVGGVRALQALSIQPGVLHLNEGHSAFATLEMVRQMMESGGQPFGEVMRDVSAMTVFTTHTPVAAGHDRFPAPLVEEHLGKIRESLHLSYEDFMGLGRVYPGDPNEPFCMTVLALEALAICQRRECSARDGLAANVAAPFCEHGRGKRADRPHYKRRSRTDLGRSPDASPVRPKPGKRLAQAPAAARNVGQHQPGRRRRAVGDAAGAQGAVDQLRAEPAGFAGAETE